MSARSEHGFTLVELIVAMFTGLIILSATLTVMELTMRQSLNSTDRVEATQHGRVALEQLVQELHSSCVWSSVDDPAAPILPGSDATNVWFLSAFSSTPLPTPVLHHVWLDASNNLKDAQFPLTGSSTQPSNWGLSAFATTPTSTRILAQNVYLQQGATSIFQYYQFISGSLAADAAHQVAPPVTASNDLSVAEVTINLAAGPNDGSGPTHLDREVNLNDEVVLAPPPATGQECQ